MSGVYVLDSAVVCSFVFFALALFPDDQLSSLPVFHLQASFRSQPRLDWTGLAWVGSVE